MPSSIVLFASSTSTKIARHEKLTALGSETYDLRKAGNIGVQPLHLMQTAPPCEAWLSMLETHDSETGVLIGQQPNKEPLPCAGFLYSAVQCAESRFLYGILTHPLADLLTDQVVTHICSLILVIFGHIRFESKPWLLLLPNAVFLEFVCDQEPVHLVRASFPELEHLSLVFLCRVFRLLHVAVDVVVLCRKESVL